MNVSYRKYHALKGLVLLLGIVLVLLLAFFATTVGVMDTVPLDVPRALISFFQGNLEGNAHYKVIVLMRLPRTVMAVLAGIGLAIAGVAMQGCTSNPLVSPFTVGISSSAAFGASLMILFGGALATNTGIVLAAFSAAMACAVLVYGMSRVTGMKPETMVLVGTALSYLFSAGTSLLEIFADEHKLSEVVWFGKRGNMAAGWNRCTFCDSMFAASYFAGTEDQRDDDGGRCAGKIDGNPHGFSPVSHFDCFRADDSGDHFVYRSDWFCGADCAAYREKADR